MRLAIRHTTRYRFDEPVIHALQRLRLTPKGTQGQRILDWQMDYVNAWPELEYEDEHCNTVTLVAVEPGAREVEISCRGTVDTEDKAGVIGHHSGHLPLWAFLAQTQRTRPGPEMKGLLRDLDFNPDDKLSFLHDLSSCIAQKVKYETGTTSVETIAEEAFARGTGVCQDHAHIFLGAARAMDIPARYVSGYLMMDDRIEQEATHAWVEAHVEELGWVGFDISNGISPDPRYVRVATGRDYDDAAPVTGISVGASSQDMHVNVAVEQQQIDQ